MIKKSIPLSSKAICLTILFIVYSVNGDRKLSTQCANETKPCNEYQQYACCDDKFKCKRVYETNQSLCIKQAELGDSCRINEDCSDILHSKCSIANKCVCRPNNIRVNNTICAPLLNEFCWKNEKCAPANSICLDNECKCRNGSLPKSNNQCIPKVLGEFCENDTTCEQIKFAKCSSQNICVCTLNTIATSPILCSPLLEEPCESKYECGVANSVCIDNKCQCESQYIPYSNTACEIPYLGMLCIDNLHCQNLINFTICNNNKCACSYNYIPKTGFMCGRPFNARCSPDESCATYNSICIDYKCQCKKNYVFQNRKCVPKHLHGACEKTPDCDGIKFAECSEEKKCRCKENYFAINETHCSLRIGELCSTNEECGVRNSNCWFNQCYCELGYIKISNEECIPTELNRSCANNNECKLIINAQCSKDNRCVCKTNYVETDASECAPLLNEHCTRDYQCATDNSVCIDFHCQCKFSYSQRSNNECVLNYLEKWCTRDEDCHDIPFAKCSNTDKCICRSNYTQLNSTTCAPLLGGLCTYNVECRTNNSVCLGNKCTCVDGYSSRSDNECLPVFLGQSCRNDEDCNKISNSQCSDDNICVCKLGYSKFDSLICLPLIGSQCNEHKECLVYNSYCDNNICQCLENYVPQSNQHCVSTQLDKICYSHYDCIEIINSQCSRYNLCVCKSNYIAVKGKICVSQFNNLCTKTTTCITNNTICIDDQCQCKPNYVNDGYNNCVPTHLGESCQRDEDCVEIRYAKCFNGMCVCNKNYIALNNTRCVSLLNSHCFSHTDCIVENSVCVSNKCRCNVGYSENSTNTCVQLPLGKSCETDKDCEYIKNSECYVDKICGCHHSYFALNEYTCVPSLGSPCLYDEQCHIDFAYCFENMCKCKPSFSAISTNQCARTRLLYSCNSMLECAESWHEQCSKDKKCVCRENNVALSISACLPILGGICWKDDQCYIENSFCDDFRCACQQNYKRISNNMCLEINEENEMK